MTKQRKTIITILLILNAIVLLGQIWPAGAPPFARIVNLLTLVANVIFFMVLWKDNKR